MASWAQAWRRPWGKLPQALAALSLPVQPAWPQKAPVTPQAWLQQAQRLPAQIWRSPEPRPTGSVKEQEQEREREQMQEAAAWPRP